MLAFSCGLFLVSLENLLCIKYTAFGWSSTRKSSNKSVLLLDIFSPPTHNPSNCDRCKCRTFTMYILLLSLYHVYSVVIPLPYGFATTLLYSGWGSLCSTATLSVSNVFRNLVKLNSLLSWCVGSLPQGISI